MIRRPILTGILVLIVLFVYRCGDNYKTPADVKNHVAWLDPRSALPVFPFGTNPIYFYFNSDGSYVCRSMNEQIFSRPEIVKYMNKNITSISIVPEELDSVFFMGELLSIRDFLKALQVQSLPAHYFFSKTGELKGVRSGYIELREFKQLLKYIAEGYVEKMDFSTFLSTDGAVIDTVWGKF
jgi:thioredoxin-related protein